MSREYFPIHADPEWQELDRLNEKVYAVYRAYRFYEDEVKNLTTIDLPTVMDVANSFASYDLQLRILTNDKWIMESKLEDFKLPQETIDLFNDWRMEAEYAVRNAQLGNYADLKKWFAVCQKRQEYAVIDLDLQEKLNLIISILPDKADPLKLPNPAWQDPKYTEYDL